MLLPLNRSRNSSDKSRSADNSVCIDDLAVPTSNSGRSATTRGTWNRGPRCRYCQVWKFRKRSGQMLVHSSLSNLSAGFELSDFCVPAKVDFLIFHLLIVDRQGAAPGITYDPPCAEAPPGAQELSSVGGGGIS